MRKTAYFLLIALAAAACSASSGTGVLDTVSPSAAQEVIATAPDDLVVLDVRTADEFQGGHLEGAINLDYYASDFQTQLADLDKAVPYVLYCNSGNRSADALDIMRDLGFSEVTEIDGGIQAWAQAGLPLVR